MRKTSALLGGIALLLLAGAGCSQVASNQAPAEPSTTQAPAPAAPTVTKIGVMLPLTGDAASYGESVKKGVEMAKNDLLTSADNVELIYEDSKCDGKEAANAINKLVSVDSVVAVVGELCSGATLAAAPVAEQNYVVMVSPASTAPTVSPAGGYIFRTIPSDALQGAFGAKLVAQKGFTKLAVLYGNEDYGVGFNKVLGEEFPKTGGTVVAAEAFEKGSVDLRTQITKIKAAKPDAIYIISNSPDSAAAALKQLKEQGLKVALFGSEGLKNADIVKGAKGAAEGMTLTTVSAGTSDFLSKHQAAYKADPGPFAAQGYDALKAIALAVKSGATTGEAIRNYLSTEEFDGASGHIKFDGNGDVAGNYDVFVVKGNKFEAAK